MTAEELQKIIQDDKKLTIDEVQGILWGLKEDCFSEIDKDLPKEKENFYYGEANAFYICLNLLEKVDNNQKKGDIENEILYKN